jgi:hypothetical protein
MATALDLRADVEAAVQLLYPLPDLAISAAVVPRFAPFAAGTAIARVLVVESPEVNTQSNQTQRICDVTLEIASRTVDAAVISFTNVETDLIDKLVALQKISFWLDLVSVNNTILPEAPISTRLELTGQVYFLEITATVALA